ncbi:MAG: hypothetical protein EXQ79_05210 [Acidimicrobiia bacterium]|nr:hypothetical protein [Acidimicrobiia bacterium]
MARDLGRPRGEKQLHLRQPVGHEHHARRRVVPAATCGRIQGVVGAPTRAPPSTPWSRCSDLSPNVAGTARHRACARHPPVPHGADVRVARHRRTLRSRVRPATTVLGTDQERWLAKGLRIADTQWNVLANQIVMQQWRFAPGNDVWNLDQWDGYPAARDRLFEELGRRGTADTVTLTGDVHTSWVGTLAEDFDDLESKVLGVEFVGPAVSTTPSAQLAGFAPTILEHSPHLRWMEGTRNGWVYHDVRPNEWRADYRLADDITVPGAPVTTASSWVVSHGGQLEGP